MIEKKTIADNVYDQLRKDITNLVFPPCTHMSETSLAQRYGVSRSPVKTALLRLEAEGLVDIRPQVGTVVSSINPRQIQDICDLRKLLESHAAAVAAGRISDQQIQELQQRCGAIPPPDADPELRRAAVFEADRYLHALILHLCGNAAISRVISLYEAEMLRIRIANADWRERLEHSEQEMQRIAAALCVRDADAARRAMEVHIENIHAAACRTIAGT